MCVCWLLFHFNLIFFSLRLFILKKKFVVATTVVANDDEIIIIIINITYCFSIILYSSFVYEIYN